MPAVPQWHPYICNIGSTNLHAGLEPPPSNNFECAPAQYLDVRFSFKSNRCSSNSTRFQTWSQLHSGKVQQLSGTEQGTHSKCHGPNIKGDQNTNDKMLDWFCHVLHQKTDNLPVHFPEKTLFNSKTACNSFNSFWANLHKIGSAEETPDLFQLQYSFTT